MSDVMDNTREHVMSDDCWCSPTREFYDEATGEWKEVTL